MSEASLRYHDDIAYYYDFFAEFAKDGAPQTVASTAVEIAQHENLKTRGTLTVIEAGIGTGRSAKALNEAFEQAGIQLRIIGLDFSENMLDICRGKGFQDLYNCNLGQDTWPVDKESVDLIIAAGSIQLLERPGHFFQQAAAILKPGSPVLVTYEPPGCPPGPEELPIFVHTPEEMGALAGNEGLKTISDKSFRAFRKDEVDIHHRLLTAQKPPVSNAHSSRYQAF